eukprot:6351341-Pyramimonas_sp.AAC.2
MGAAGPSVTAVAGTDTAGGTITLTGKYFGRSGTGFSIASELYPNAGVKVRSMTRSTRFRPSSSCGACSLMGRSASACCAPTRFGGLVDLGANMRRPNNRWSLFFWKTQNEES